jgi:hypothetical protein
MGSTLLLEGEKPILLDSKRAYFRRPGGRLEGNALTGYGFYRRTWPM